MISVIVIGRNEGERLSACLTSVRCAMGVLQHELIYVDSRSADDSLDRARAQGARCFLLAEEHPTAGLGRWVGTQVAKGGDLLFLDGDMRLMPGFVEQALLALHAQGADAVCGQRTDVFLRDGAEVGRAENVFGCTAAREAPEFGGALMIQASALAACGGWAADTVACEEAELHARLKDARLSVRELPVPMIEHTDVQRDARGVWGVLFSRRRLGEGEALRCAMASGKARAYLRHERGKFARYALDWLSVALLCFGGWGLAAACGVQTAQLGYLLAQKRGRTFVSQKLFFFALPLGMLSYRPRSRAYTAE